MREIKFRAWVLRDLALDGLMENMMEYDVESFHDPLYEYKQDNIILMQYTGLKDKNGKEIYEGDIVPIKVWHSFGWKQGGKEKTYNAVVSYSPEEWSYVFEFINYDGHIQKTPFNKAVKDSYVVIGNRFENPELLKTK